MKRFKSLGHVFRKCKLPQHPGDMRCPCATNVTINTLDKIKNDPNLWFTWINTSVGFGDEYISNYYVRRLTSGTSNSEQKRSFSKAKRCVFQNICNESIDVMTHILPPAACALAERGMEDVSKYLYQAMSHLKNHFKVIILEKFKELKAAVMVAKAINEDSYEDILELLASEHVQERTGFLFYPSSGIAATSYTEYMPQSVIDFFLRDNAADIKLYEDAVTRYNDS